MFELSLWLFRHAGHAFRARAEREGAGVWLCVGGANTFNGLSHSLPSAMHRINAGLLQSHNGKSNSITPPSKKKINPPTPS